MDCRRIRELVLTDLADGELNENMRREVAEHIGSCASCEEFRRTVSEKALGVFRMAHRQEPPAYLWSRIREKVVSGASRRQGALDRFIEAIGSIFSALGRLPKPALVFAATGVVIIALVMARPLIRDHAANIYLAEQAEFMARLDTAESNGNNFFDIEVRTGTENFL